MTVFAASVARLFADPNLAVDAQYRAGGVGQGLPIRLIRRAPDRITEFGAARILSETLTADVRTADLPEPRPNDLIVIGADSYVIQGEPIRDRERLIWTLELVPA